MQRGIQKEKMIFLILSAILLSISTPISIALDNIAIGIGLLGLILIYKKLKLSDLDFRVLGVSVVGTVSSLLSIKPLHSFENAHYLWHFLPYFITSRIKREKIPVNLVILGIFGAISSFAVIFESLTGVNPKHINSLSSIHFLSHPVRAEGFFNTPLTTAGVISVIFLIFFGLLIFAKERKFRIYSFFISIIMFLGLLFTFTRSYWVGSMAAFFLLPVINLKSKIARIVPLSVIFVAYILYLSIPSVHNRVQTIIHYKQNVSAMDRIVLWESGFDLYKHYNIKNKLIGCGSGNLLHFLKPHLIKRIKKVFGEKAINSHIFSAVHNEYLQILLKWGIIGLVVWLYLWIYVLYRNIVFIIETDNEFYKALIIGITMGFVAFLVGGFFEHNVGDAEVIIFIMYLLGINQNIVGGEKNEVLS